MQTIRKRPRAADTGNTMTIKLTTPFKLVHAQQRRRESKSVANLAENFLRSIDIEIGKAAEKGLLYIDATLIAGFAELSKTSLQIVKASLVEAEYTVNENFIDSEDDTDDEGTFVIEW